MNKINERDRRIWVFNSGNTFAGNPKWLYIYINNHRPDISAYWFCDSKEIVRQIRKLGYKAYTYQSAHRYKFIRNIQQQTGVFVVNQVKEHIPKYLEGAFILNLWHGVGCKNIERHKVDYGFLAEKIVKKYIRYNSIYKNQQLFLVTSPKMEEHFKLQCGIDDDKVIRAGYPCCVKIDKVATYNHDILELKGLDRSAKIAIYAPTYREDTPYDFFGRAIYDMDKLITKLKEKNMLLIFKLHPLMEKDYQYNVLKEHYKDCKYLYFWDNKNDIYEIFDKIELAIIDYSSIFYDMLAAGVPYFCRYFFDYDDKNVVGESALDYKEMTCGKLCNNFDELLSVFDDYKSESQNNRESIYEYFWSYSEKDSLEIIVNKTIEYQNEKNNELPILYSFDVFDTLIARKTLIPKGVFYYIRDNIRKSNIIFPEYIVKEFPEIRMMIESNLREYYKKTVRERQSDKLEISLDEIYDWLQKRYNLSQEQVELLKRLEIEGEYENVCPIEKNVNRVKELLSMGEKVVLISDMYLPYDVIKNMLKIADPILAELPLYLSSKLGVQKTTKKLFMNVFSDLNYNYSQWIHCGDNVHADKKMPNQIGIKTQLISRLQFNNYENSLVRKMNSYDGYLLANIFARYRESNNSNRLLCFAHNYVSTYFVPYVSWVIKSAINEGTECLYFLSRDGYHLKRIADRIIQIKGYKIKTKYIYGSRKAWRVPSYINKVDEEFFGEYGNFWSCKNPESLLSALEIDKNTFLNMFPEFSAIINKRAITKDDIRTISNRLKGSKEYHEHLLNVAKTRRKIICEYINQEIDFDEKFAVVEYWGRGYTQDCFVRLVHHAINEEIDIPFYYARSIYPSIGHSVRYNYTSSTCSMIFVEAIFANLDYETISEYEYENSVIKPKIVYRQNNEELNNALEIELLRFCDEFYKNNLIDEDAIERMMFNFGLEYSHYNAHKDPYIWTIIGGLKDSVSVNAEEVEFAPPITFSNIINSLFGLGRPFITKSKEISYNRTDKKIKLAYKFRDKYILKNRYLKKVYSSIKRRIKVKG